MTDPAIAKAQRTATKVKRLPKGERVVRIAASFVGVAEHGENRGRDVDAIIRAVNGSLGEAWCGDFVHLVARLAGLRSANYGGRAWAMARYVGRFMRKVTGPQAGDKVYFGLRGNDHTAIFVGWTNRHTGDFQVIGGNQGDGRPGFPTGGVNYAVRNRRDVRWFVRMS